MSKWIYLIMQYLKVDKIDVDKLKTVPVDLNKLIDVIKKTVYDKLFAKVNNIDTRGFF